MTDKQIKSAKGITETTLKKRGHLSECFCAYCFADKTNINLAQSYLSVGKEMLEERSLNKECPQPYSVGYEQRIPEIKGFNEARRLCIMAKMKSVPSVEEIALTVASFIKPMYKDASEILKQDLTESCGIQIRNITQAIHARIVEKTR